MRPEYSRPKLNRNSWTCGATNEDGMDRQEVGGEEAARLVRIEGKYTELKNWRGSKLTHTPQQQSSVLQRKFAKLKSRVKATMSR